MDNMNSTYKIFAFDLFAHTKRSLLDKFKVELVSKFAAQTNTKILVQAFWGIIFLLTTYFLLPTKISYSQAFCPINNAPLNPKQVKSLENFKKISILDEGRIKPLDTYAHNLLLRFSGKTSFGKRDAIDWLARLLFAAETTREDKIFLVNNPAIPQALGIDLEPKRRYSFAQIEPHIEKLQELAFAADHIDEKKRDIVENELIRLYGNIKVYAELSLNFVFALPHSDFAISDPANLSQLGFSSEPRQVSFLDLALRADQLNKLAQDLESKEFSERTDSQKEILFIMKNLFQWGSSYGNLPLTLIPSYVAGDESWSSPWDAIAQYFYDPECRAEMILLQDLLFAYWNGDQLNFDLAVKNFIQSVRQRLEEKSFKNLGSVDLEILFNRLKLFTVAQILYFLAFFIFLFSLIISKTRLRLTAFSFVSLGFILHLAGLIIRAIILERPPVSNLYETFVFVGFIAVLTGMIIECIQKGWLGISISSICGFIFLVLAGKFSMEGDTLKMLVAVLNSNFWLSTHVLSITIGYAGVCVAGVIGHAYLLQRIFQSKDKEKLTSTYKILLGALGFGLSMTFLGTNLGGIWADQSWGRFWGWDPKENGALLIILWCAILFHAKIVKIIGPLGLAVGSVLGIIVVMWAWFGVNLLSVGLHSYGFTSGIAMNLAIYVVIQISFLLIAYPLAKRK